jgi:hypothetical protein
MLVSSSRLSMNKSYHTALTEHILGKISFVIHRHFVAYAVIRDMSIDS